jgi:hypothetical protein
MPARQPHPKIDSESKSGRNLGAHFVVTLPQGCGAGCTSAVPAGVPFRGLLWTRGRRMVLLGDAEWE